MHPVFTVAQIEPCPDSKKDPFDRPRPDLPDFVYVDGENDRVKSYEMKRIIIYRSTKRRGMEHLIRWKGYGPEFDKWRSISELGDSSDLLQDYQRQQISNTSPDPAKQIVASAGSTVSINPASSVTPAAGPASITRKRERSRKAP